MSTVVEATSESSKVVSGCNNAVTYAITALKQTTIVSIYDLVSSSCCYGATAEHLRLSSVTLIPINTYSLHTPRVSRPLGAD